MRSKFEQRSFSLLFIALIVLFSLLIFNKVVYANEYLQVNGTEFGLEVTPEDGAILNELNMFPGQIMNSKVIIKNNDLNPFELSLKIKRLDEKLDFATPDLYEQLIMTINNKGEILFDGPMKQFVSNDGISLEKVEPLEKQELDIQISLPGPETGNEFMGLSISNQWIFTAQSDTEIIEDESFPLGFRKGNTEIIKDEYPPLGSGAGMGEGDIEIIEDEEIPIGKVKIPKTTDIPTELFFLAGVAIVAVGIVLKKKGK